MSDVYAGPEVEDMHFAASGTTLYFGNSSSLYSLPSGATTPTKVLSTKSGIGYIAADASGVYAALNHGSFSDGVIVKLE